MRRKLDFIVFGTARSGTTAAAKFLNTSDRIFCGVEAINVGRHHGKLNLPHDLASARDPLPERISDAHTLGHKRPNYFRRLKGVMRETENAKAIICIRPLLETAASYNRRAAERHGGWPPGRIDIFALADAILLVKALASAPELDAVIVPQPALFQDWRATMGVAAEHVSGDNLCAFNETTANRLCRAGRERLADGGKHPLSSAFMEAVQFANDCGLTEFFQKKELAHLGEVRAEVARIARAAPKRHASFIKQYILDTENRHATDYFRQWSNWKPH